MISPDAAPNSEAVAAQIVLFETALADAASPRDAQAVRDRFLGRKNSVVASWMQMIAAVPPDQKREIGRLANELKQAIDLRWTAYQSVAAADARPAGALDVTLPGRVPLLGHRHPLTVIRDRLEEIFTRMGFAVVEGPEAEDEWHCFDALNMPAEHPARDMQDTLYLASPIAGDSPSNPRTLLRTHTSSMQIRYMQAHQPPVRIVVPGRVYRRDDLDLTHSPAFGQIEGLAVGEGLSLADLKGTLLAFARQMFSPTTRVRFRPSFFPYTEPSAEIDVRCWQCDGAGCAMCKKTGWIQLGGCGMVHPAVFEAVGYDPERYTGFAWGIGIERIAILRYRVEDIRLFYENDMRFLEQFPVLDMRLLVSWLRDFVEVPESPQEIAEKLASCGFEVASIEPIDKSDAVIDLEVTANRPDCLSVLGLAREVATAFDRRLDQSFARDALEPASTGAPDRVTVTIEDEELCPRYAAAVADLRPASSPAWLTRRLQASGVRSISPVVDITNYVLFEIGQPMHAFDLDKLAGAEIRVRRAKSGETITTLDGLERKLEVEMLVIADRDRAQALAGVMGGAHSEVSASTTRIVFESAYFKPSSVRRTSKRLDLKTEASARFERGADIDVAVAAIERAAALMEKIGAGRVATPAVDRYPRPRGPLTVHLRRDRLARLLGTKVPDADVTRFLRGLGLGITPATDGWDVIVPTFRVDVLREVDLIEEVGRHYGLEKLEPTFPPVLIPAAPPDRRTTRDQLLRRVLTAAGLSEAVTFGFIEARAAATFARANGVPDVPIANPLSAKFDTLRSSLLPGLVDAVAHNRRHGRRDVRLFEIGARFAAGGETRGVGVAWTGGSSTEHWSGGGRDVDFFDVKGIVELLARALGITIGFEPTTEPFLVAGQAASITTGPGSIAGILGQVTSAAVDARGLPRQDRLFVAELDLDALERARGAGQDATRSLPRYPFVVRDVSIVVPDTLPAEIIRGTIRSATGETPAPLVDVVFFDRYQGTAVPKGHVSLSVRLTFQSADRTLTDAQVQQSFDAILAALVREHSAVQR